MNEQKQLQLFLNAFALIKANLVSEVADEVEKRLDPRFLKLEGNYDWVIGALDTDEKERLALGFNFDREHADHERRIKKLELAVN